MTKLPNPTPTTNPLRIEAQLMDAAHEAHLQRILSQFGIELRAKYEAGQREHGGNLWEKPGMLDYAIEEALDQVVYLYTLREQLLQAAASRPSAQPCGCDAGEAWTCETHR